MVSSDRNFTPGKVDKRQEQIEQSIQRYLEALETADTQPAEVDGKTERLQEKIETLREQMRRMAAIREEVEAAARRAAVADRSGLTFDDLAREGHRRGGL